MELIIQRNEVYCIQYFYYFFEICNGTENQLPEWYDFGLFRIDFPLYSKPYAAYYLAT